MDMNMDKDEFVECIRAFVNGEPVQYKDWGSDAWHDLVWGQYFNAHTVLRKKPKPKKKLWWRVAILEYKTIKNTIPAVYKADTESDMVRLTSLVSQNPVFVCWLQPWTEYEYD